MSALGRDARARALKLATGELVGSLGGIEGAAASLEKGKSVVGRWANRNDPDHFINVADLVNLELIAPRPVVTEQMCKLLGGLFVPHVDLAADEGSLSWLVMQLSKELGQLSGEIANALADGMVTDTEASAAEGHLQDLMRVGHQMASALAQIRERGRG
ncbi:MAG: hypothetical protein EBR82_29450 [Caulobacteraceae bacterium]|nr:hypothetical protein [Caulobacteraceae bacterium]